MSEHFFEFKGTKLFFTKSGNGEKIILAFHGFGQDHQAFDGLSTKLAGQYTVFSFDIFFHGKSEWNRPENSLEKYFWKDFLSEFLKQNLIERFSLLGFSMGAKFALASLEAFPEKLDHIFLIAPDGIKINVWYRLATYPLVIRKLFKSMILKPKRFLFITTIAHKMGIIDKGVLRFAKSQMITEAKRQQVYLAWIVFRQLKFRMTKVADLINANNVNLTVIIGKHDKIITEMNMSHLLKKIPNHTLEILYTGHNGLISKWARTLS